jgi:hypothetical protein
MNNRVVMPVNFNMNALSDPPALDGVEFRGNTLGDGINVYGLRNWYSGTIYNAQGVPSKATVPYISPNKIIFLSVGGECGFDGFTHYGSIIDTHAAGLGPLGVGDIPWFVKSREKWSNGGRDILGKSKPFVGALNLNATAVVEVCEMPAATTPVLQNLTDHLKTMSLEKQRIDSVTRASQKQLADAQLAAAKEQLAAAEGAANNGDAEALKQAQAELKKLAASDKKTQKELAAAAEREAALQRQLDELKAGGE